jgi:branched-chain amino acid transport system substrate-binding protein
LGNSKETNEAQAKNLTITLGAVISLSGKYKNTALHVKRGYDIGAEQINKKGGVRIGKDTYMLKIKYIDDESSAAKAKQATEKLVKEYDIRYLLGPYGSTLNKAIYPIAEKFKIPLVQSQGAAKELFNPNFKYTFSILSSADKYLQPAVTLLGESALSRGRPPQDLKVGIIVKSDSGSQDIRSGVVEEAKKWHMQLKPDIIIRDFENDLPNALDQVATEFPDLLAISVQSSGARPIIEEIVKRKIGIPMIAMTHCDAVHLEKLAPKSNYILCAAQWDAYTNYTDPYFGSSVDYSSSYKIKYEGLPPYQAAGATAAVILFAQAFEEAQSLDREKIKNALEKMKLQTMYGEIRFDEDKNKGKPSILYQIIDGVYKNVWPLSSAWAQLVYPMPSWSERLID